MVPYLQPDDISCQLSQPDDISWMISAVACVIGPEIFARTAAGYINRTAAQDFCLVCVSVLAGLRVHLHLQEILLWT